MFVASPETAYIFALALADTLLLSARRARRPRLLCAPKDMSAKSRSDRYNRSTHGMTPNRAKSYWHDALGTFVLFL
jgi:hypothetical protein